MKKYNYFHLSVLGANQQRVAQKQHGPHDTWTVQNHDLNRVLWRSDTHAASIWEIDGFGNQLNYREHGPFEGWQPQSLSGNRLLWRHDSGKISLWKLNDDLSQHSYREYGPFQGWTVLNYEDGRILWRHESNAISYWLLNESDEQASYTEHQPDQGFRPVCCSDGQILWVNAEGRACIWKMDENGQRQHATYLQAEAGYQPVRLHAQRLTWEKANGQVLIWHLNEKGECMYQSSYGPFSQGSTYVAESNLVSVQATQSPEQPAESVMELVIASMMRAALALHRPEAMVHPYANESQEARWIHLFQSSKAARNASKKLIGRLLEVPASELDMTFNLALAEMVPALTQERQKHGKQHSRKWAVRANESFLPAVFAETMQPTRTLSMDGIGSIRQAIGSDYGITFSLDKIEARRVTWPQWNADELVCLVSLITSDGKVVNLPQPYQNEFKNGWVRPGPGETDLPARVHIPMTFKPEKLYANAVMILMDDDSVDVELPEFVKKIIEELYKAALGAVKSYVTAQTGGNVLLGIGTAAFLDWLVKKAIGVIESMLEPTQIGNVSTQWRVNQGIESQFALDIDNDVAHYRLYAHWEGQFAQIVIPNYTQISLSKVSAIKFADIALSKDGSGFMWLRDAEGYLWRWENNNAVQMQELGKFAQISVGSSSNIWAISKIGKLSFLYSWDGKSFKLVAGEVKQIEAGPSGEVYALSLGGKLLRRNSNTKLRTKSQLGSLQIQNKIPLTWEKLSDQTLRRICVTSEGKVCGISSSGKAVVYDPKTKGFLDLVETLGDSQEVIQMGSLFAGSKGSVLGLSRTHIDSFFVNHPIQNSGWLKIKTNVSSGISEAASYFSPPKELSPQGVNHTYVLDIQGHLWYRYSG